MYTIKGFISITALANNTPDDVSPVGEISGFCKTFARDVTEYGNVSQHVRLLAFTSKKDESRITVPAEYSQHILDISQWVYSNSINGTIRNDQAEFQRLITGQFKNSMTKVFSGPMIEAKGNWFPEWLGWELASESHKESNIIKVYFSDQAFRDGYDDYEIIIVPPIEPVDTFQGIQSQVEKALSNWNLPDHGNRILEKADGVPYTYMIPHEYTWHDREDFDSTLFPTNWSVIIYGIAGRNPSHIKQAYREQILEQSAHPHSDWVKVFPDIFTTTRFTFVPGWKIRGIPNLTEEGSLYSPILPYDFLLKAAGKFLNPAEPTLDPKIIFSTTRDLTTVPFLYKSLNSVCIAGEENRIGMKSMHEVLESYALIHTGSPDISLVDADTTAWIRLAILAVIVAEDYHPHSATHEISIQAEETDPNIQYAVFEHKNIEYRIVTRKSVWANEPK